MSAAKQLFIEKEVAFHLGTFNREFETGAIDENYVENTDETHFTINMDNGRTLGFSGESEVKYADVFSGGEGVTMMVCLNGGRDASVQNTFMVFKISSRSYPIRGVPDDIPRISYRIGPKGWMDTKIMPQWPSEKRLFSLYQTCERELCMWIIAAAIIKQRLWQTPLKISIPSYDIFRQTLHVAFGTSHSASRFVCNTEDKAGLGCKMGEVQIGTN